MVKVIKYSTLVLALSVIWVFVYKYIPVAYTPLMAIRYIEDNDISKIQHQWRSLKRISSHLPLAVISSEDQNFFQHFGFDFQAIQSAFVANQQGAGLVGGSTISQQTAKNVFLWPQRSWLRKGLEAWFTLLIEIFWSKERILEVYVNSIEMGPGIFGAQAAANFWFKTSAKKLTEDQSAALAAILPNPNRYQASPPSKYIQKRKRWIKRQIRQLSIQRLHP